MAIAPVDAGLFIRLFDIGTQAGLAVAEGKMITQASVNEALQAAIRELGKLQVTDKEAYLARLSCLRSVFDSGRFATYFRQGDEGHVFVEHALLRAMATSPCTTLWNEQLQGAVGQFDLADLERGITGLRSGSPVSAGE